MSSGVGETAAQSTGNLVPANTTVAPTQAQAAAFIAQAGFGGTLADINEVVSLGFDGWLTKQMNTVGSRSHLDAMRRIDRTFQGFWQRTMWRKFCTSPDQVRQRLVLAWTQILVVSVAGQGGDGGHYRTAYYLDVLDRNALGNFRTLLEEVTLTPAMGGFLNMRGNRKASGNAQPDENFAREVMQLFTIGLDKLNPDGTVVYDADGDPVPTYGEADVSGLAAALTGWDRTQATDPNGPGDFFTQSCYRETVPMVLYPDRHATTPKTFLGVTIPANTGGTESLKIALDTLFNHPNTGPFIAIRLIKRLVTSNPVPAYVQRVAAAFADNGSGVRGDLGAVVRAILLDPEARGQSIMPPEQRGKLREPVVRFLQFCRTFRVTSGGGNWNHENIGLDTQLAQLPVAAPSVFNFYTYNAAPPNSSTSRAGLTAPEFTLVNEPNVVGYLNFMRAVVEGGTDFQPNYELEWALSDNARALVDRCDLLLTGSTLSTRTKDIIVAAVGSLPNNKNFPNAQRRRVYAAVMLIMACPEYLVQKV